MPRPYPSGPAIYFEGTLRLPALSEWAGNLSVPSKLATFFNILDTHDGVGLMGVRGILPKEDIDFIIQQAKGHGAYISYKMGENRIEEPYEINTTWWSAINRDDSDENLALQVKRYFASRSIQLVIQGIPAVYAHGAIGTPNDHDLVRNTKHNRDVNRGVIDSNAVVDDLKDPHSKISIISREGPKFNLTHTKQRAFHPNGPQYVLMISPDVFTVLRVSPESDQHILTMTNVTSRICTIEIPLSELSVQETRWHDLLSEKEWKAEGKELSITLQPYDVIWLKPSSELNTVF
jgi:hypothetical protein